MNSIPLLIPAAGYGSRLFPVTWGVPKELFPLGNKPAIDFLLEEAYEANIKDVIIVTSSRKETLFKYLNYKKGINDYFLNNEESEKLDCLNKMNERFNYNFCFQEFALGVGNAILCAKEFIKNNDFFFMGYPDDVIVNSKKGFLSLIEIHKKYNCSIIALEKIDIEKISSYGVISYNNEIDNGIFEIKKIVEKPKSDEAPSDLAVIGRYILSKEILNYLDKQENNKPCFIKAINDYLLSGNKILAVELKTLRYDIGTVYGWINAINGINFFEKKQI